MNTKSIHIIIVYIVFAVLPWLIPVVACAETYTVKFEALRGGNSFERTNISPDTTIENPGIPSTAYYELVFKGWYQATPDNFQNFKSDREVFHLSGGYYYKYADKPFDFNTPITGNMTLYAKWEMPCYFYSGDNAIFYQDYYYVDTYLPKPPGDQSTWYYQNYGTDLWSFDGWSNGPDNFKLYASSNTPATSVHTVAFDTGVSGVNLPDATVGEGSLIPIPLFKLVNGTKYFAGWYTDESYTSAWNIQYDRISSGNAPTKLYAKWSDQPVWIVRFDSQGGSAVATLNAVADNDQIAPPASPVKPGWKFEGWYKEAECKESWNFGTDRVTADMTLYAKWGDFKVTFKTGKNESDFFSKFCPGGKTVERPSDPTCPGYLFKGWSRKEDVLDLWSFEYWKVDEDVTLYAWWVPTYTVTFISDKSVCCMNYVQQREPGQANIFRVERPEDPVKAGYQFSGWYVDENKWQQAWNFNMGVNSNLVLYACWREFNVTFNAAPGHFGHEDEHKVFKERRTASGENQGRITPPDEPILEGNLFTNWYQDAKRTLSWDFTNEVTSDMVLYAGWNATVTLSGKVTDQKTGVAISGAVIELFVNATSVATGFTSVTDDVGQYSITVPASSSGSLLVRLRASHPAYEMSHGSPISLATNSTIDIAMAEADVTTFYINLSSGSAGSSNTEKGIETVWNQGVKYEQAKVTNYSYLGYIQALSEYRGKSDFYDTKVGPNILYADGARTSSLAYYSENSSVSLGYSFRKSEYEYRVEEEAKSLVGIDGVNRCYYYVRRWKQGSTVAESNLNRESSSTYTRVRGLPNVKPSGSPKILADKSDELHTVVIIDRLAKRGAAYEADEIENTYVLSWETDNDPTSPQYRQNRFVFYPFDEEQYRISGDRLSAEEIDKQGLYPWAIEAEPQVASMGYYASTGFEKGVKEQITGIEWKGSNLVGNEQLVWLNGMNGKNQALANRMLRTADENANYAGAKLVWDSPFNKNGFLGDIVRIDHRFNIRRNYLDPGVELEFLANGDNGFIAFLNGKYIACSNSFLDEDGRSRFGVYDFLDESTIINAMINPETGAPFGDPPLKGVDWSTIITARVSPSLLNLGGKDSLYNNVLTVYAVNARQVSGEYADEEGKRVIYNNSGNSMYNPSFIAYALIGKKNTNMSNLIDAEPLNSIAYQGGTSRSGDAFPRPRFRFWKLNYDKVNDLVKHSTMLENSALEFNSWQVDGIEYIPNSSKYPDLIYPDAPFRAYYYNGQEILNGANVAPVGAWRIRTVWDDRVREVTVDGLNLAGGQSTELNAIYTSNIVAKFVEIRSVTKTKMIDDNIRSKPEDVSSNLQEPYVTVPYNDRSGAPSNTVYVGAYGIAAKGDDTGTKPFKVVYPLQAGSQFDMRIAPRLLLDEPFSDEKEKLEKTLSEKCKGYKNPVYFFADLVNHENGDVIIKPDLLPGDTAPTPVTIYYPQDAKLKSIRVFHFPEVQRRQLPQTYNDPQNDFSRKWWGDDLFVDDYTQIQLQDITFDESKGCIVFTPPSSGMFAIVYDLLKVKYKYLPTNGVEVPVGVPVEPGEKYYAANENVTVEKRPFSSDYALFGWKDNASEPLNNGGELIPGNTFLMPDRDVELNGYWAVAQVKHQPSDDYNKKNKYANLYLRLNDAVKKAWPGQTVQLMVDVKEDVTINKKIAYDSKFVDLPESVNKDENTIDGRVVLLAKSTLGYPAHGTANVTLVNDLLATTVGMKAYVFGYKALVNYNGNRIQAENAYFDLTLPVANRLDPDGWQLYSWYPVNLPFNAKLNRVTRTDGGTLMHPYDFGIAEYNGSRRAAKGIGNEPSNPDNDWLYIAPGTGKGDLTINDLNIGNHQTMQACVPYMVRTSGTETLRFHAEDGTFGGKTRADIKEYSSNLSQSEKHSGWNYVAQSLGTNATVDLPMGAIIQVSQSFSSDRDVPSKTKREQSYVPTAVNNTIGNIVISPYTNFFYQTNTDGVIEFVASNDTATTRSTGRGSGSLSGGMPERYEVRLTDGQSYDVLYVSASPDDKAIRYQLGYDVMKMDGMAPRSLRLWSWKDHTELCAIHAPLLNGKADIPLLVCLPGEGEYNLSVGGSMEEGSTLWLLENDVVVCNLTKEGRYTIDGKRALQASYSLRLVKEHSEADTNIRMYGEKGRIVIEGLPKGNDFIVINATGMIVAQGKATGTGMVIRVPVRSAGVYIVSVEGKQTKIVVQE